MPSSDASFAPLSCLALQPILTDLFSFPLDIRLRYLFFPPFAHYLPFSSHWGPDKARLFAPFIIIVPSLGARKTSHQERRLHAAPNQAPLRPSLGLRIIN
jgi:hypothetical protein